MNWKKKKKEQQEKRIKFDKMMNDYDKEKDPNERVKKIIKIGKFVIGKK